MFRFKCLRYSQSAYLQFIFFYTFTIITTYYHPRAHSYEDIYYESLKSVGRVCFWAMPILYADVCIDGIESDIDDELYNGFNMNISPKSGDIVRILLFGKVRRGAVPIGCKFPILAIKTFFSAIFSLSLYYIFTNTERREWWSMISRHGGHCDCNDSIAFQISMLILLAATTIQCASNVAMLIARYRLAEDLRDLKHR